MNFDVVVIGASSAGLYAAEILAKAGKKVALFEESDPIDPDPRLYIITPGLFRVLPGVDPGLIRNRIDKLQLSSGSAEAEIELFRSDLVVDRRDLLLYLIDRAEKAGVKIFSGSEFKGFINDQNGTQLNILRQDEEIYVRTTTLIAADGIQSSTRKKLLANSLMSVPLLQAEVTLPPDWDLSVTKVWFDVETTPYFYWLIPDRDQKAVVGLIARRGSDIRGYLDGFLEKQDLRANTYQAGTAAMHAAGTEVEGWEGEVRVLFVGESAGQVKVTTVGGTVTGLAGAKAAAEAILLGNSYQDQLKAVQKELNLHLFIRQLLNQMESRDYQVLIQSLSAPVKKMLRVHDRDQMRSHFWKLAVIQPRFIPLGSKLLLKRIFSPLLGN